MSPVLSPTGLIQGLNIPAMNPVQGDGQTSLQQMSIDSGVAASNAQAQGIIDNPQAAIQQMSLVDAAPQMTATTGTTLDPTAAQYQMTQNALNQPVATAGFADTASAPMVQQAQTFDTVTSTDRITDIGQAQAATGDVRPEAVVDAPMVDMQGLATGVNIDGTTNFVGEALGQAATQNISNVIDTTTVSGKLLAQSLGEGNYTDARATLQGQMEILSSQFTGPTGEPTIPTWAAGAARNVSRIAAFKGVTGTAATAAMSQAIMEASIPIAQQDATFFQTITQQNLDNRQQATINTANILSRMQLADLDNRMQAAVVNSSNFMQMDMANLSNEQQSEIINTQSRVQSILQESNEANAARLFGANAQNDFAKFYSQLGTQIEQFNATQRNNMSQFNAGAINDNNQFNATIENQREQFYRDMQFNVDIANAKWRQTIETTNTQMQFQAAATDVQNMFALSTESLNRIWDRADAELDYAWKTSENELDRQNRIVVQEMQVAAQRAEGSANRRASGLAAFGGAVGRLGAAALPFILSDSRLKEDLQQIGTLSNGINLYKWRWSDTAHKLGINGTSNFGVVAQEVQEVIPEAVSVGNHGYYMVDYSRVIK